jgi:hypothetical protein
MMTIARASHPFYTVLEVEASTFDDVKQRLETQNILWKYLMTHDDGSEIIVFGSTALKKEKTGF